MEQQKSAGENQKHQSSYQEELETQLEEWEALINEYVRKAEAATAEAKLKYQEQIESLRAQHTATRHRLQELRNTSGEAWEDLRVGLDSAWQELRRAFERAAEKFKE